MSDLPSVEIDINLVEDLEITASLRNVRLSPVHRMPLEILSEIFELYGLPEDGIFTAKHDIIRRTYVLSTTCAAWRNAAYATPRIWDKLCFDVSLCRLQVEREVRRKRRKVVKQTPFEFDGLKRWIARSEGFPLELYLELLQEDDEQNVHRATQMLDCILEFRHRIRVIYLSGILHASLPLFHLPRSSLPLLETLSLAGTDMEDHNVQAFIELEIEAFLGAPKLRDVSIMEFGYMSLLTALQLPLEQLTSFNITTMTVHHDPSLFVEKICLCRDLVSLEFHLEFLQGFFTDSPILLPALRILDISFPRLTDGQSSLFHNLTAPLLEEFTLRWEGQHSEEIAADVVEFQKRSATTLSTLKLALNFLDLDRIPDSDTRNFMTILAAFPTVRSFQLHNNLYTELCDMDSILQAMIYTSGHPVLLPKLATFELLYKRPFEFLQPSSLVPMILSRCWPEESGLEVEGMVSRLQKVTLRGLPGEDITSQISHLPGLIVDCM